MEAIADHQKNNFKSDPKNKDNILQSGLWSWCRHPNYFGEALLWWGFFLICCSSTTWYLIICSPLLINFLLIKVSGVPMLEKKYEGRTDYEAYKKNTSAFVPFLNRLKL
jgi:steroid 5-alpha reductase family enzyme